MNLVSKCTRLAGHLRNVGGVVAAAAAASAVVAPAAFATTMYPQGDSMSLSATPVTIPLGGFFRGANFYEGTTTCTLNGGAFTAPLTKSGAVNFTTIPTYTGCTEILKNKNTKVPVTITTAGTWSLTAQYGTAAVTVAIPRSGLTINVDGEPAWYGSSEWNTSSFTGGWNNGFTEPVNVGTAISYGGTVTFHLSGGGEKSTKEIPFSQSLQTVTDTTHPASRPVLGP